jgi:hypothetical protein
MSVTRFMMTTMKSTAMTTTLMMTMTRVKMTAALVHQPILLRPTINLARERQLAHHRVLAAPAVIIHRAYREV